MIEGFHCVLRSCASQLSQGVGYRTPQLIAKHLLNNGCECPHCTEAAAGPQLKCPFIIQKFYCIPYSSLFSRTKTFTF